MSLAQQKADALLTAWRGRYHTAPSMNAMLLVLAVADLETGMGEYRGRGRTMLPGPSHNWGQIQRRTITADEKATLAAGGIPTPRDEHEFLSDDTSPDTGAYVVWLWRFANDIDGADKLLQILLDNRPTIRATIDSMSPADLAAAMYDSHYYEGSHSRNEPGGREKNIAAYGATITAHYSKLTSALGDYVPRDTPPPSPSPTRPRSGSGGGTGAGLILLLVVVGAAVYFGGRSA